MNSYISKKFSEKNVEIGITLLKKADRAGSYKSKHFDNIKDAIEYILINCLNNSEESDADWINNRIEELVE